MRPSNVIVFNAVDAASDQTGAAIYTGFMYQVSVQAVVTSTATGTYKVQVSNDPAGPGLTPTNWSDLSGATKTVSSAGVTNIPKTDCCYEWIRVLWAKNTGAGVISIRVKLIGA